MKSHPMDVNTNTRIRWEVIKKIPEISSLKGKKVLDIGAGLGFFSVRFSEFGAKVLAVDVDKSSLEYLFRRYNIQTQYINLENDTLPSVEYDLIFIGELLEHIKNPSELLNKAKNALAPSGSIIVTAPALEGLLIHTKGKRLAHHEGSERHERDGFRLEELQEVFSHLKMDITYHTFCVFLFAELFMQLTKWGYIKKKSIYKGQSDVIAIMKSFKYRMLKLIYPVLLFVFMIEQYVCSILKLGGHCHIVVVKKRNGE